MLFFKILTFDSIILSVYSYALRYLNIQSAWKQCRYVPKMSLNASLHGFCVIRSHMIIWLKLLKFLRSVKKPLNGWTLEIAAVPSTVTSELISIPPTCA